MQIKKYIKLYLPNTPYLLAFMMQRTEYRTKAMVSWLHRINSINVLMTRNKYKYTLNSTIYLIISYLIYLFIYVIIIFIFYLELYYLAIVTFLLFPLILIATISILAYFTQVTLVKTMNNRKLKKARIIFEQHKGIKIAVLGSYGKTTTKEILSEILSGSDKKIAKTPLNKNVCLSHANWASKLDGDEDVLIIEYGEESPGDIAKLAILTKPTHVVITGIAPNHLEHFKNIDELYKEFNSIFRFVKTENVYVSSQYNEFKKDIPKDIVSYSNNGVDGWVAKDVQLFVDHTVFIASNKNVKLPIRKGLLGEHNIPAVLLSLAIGSKIGINSKGLMIGVSKLKPHSHRMSHYKLGEVDIIDDTYNGNIEGFRAGLTLLKKLKAKRKIYVTPGLVDQGIENIAVHEEIGRLIIDTNPDIVVLMNNSNTKIILQYINNKDFKGKILLEDNPLAFYQNLEHFTASGDLVLMQNDLPDEYA